MGLRPREPRKRQSDGPPWWWLGIDRIEAPGWWWLAAVVVPVTSWALALVFIPYGESINEMRPTASGISLLAAPLLTLVAAHRRSDRLAFARATTLALGAILLILGALALVVLPAFVVYVATSYGE